MSSTVVERQINTGVFKMGGFKVKMFRNKTARFGKQNKFLRNKTKKMFDGFS